MRKQNWPTLLAEFLAEAQHESFKRGVHDCALFAAKAAEVMTGDDYVREFKNVMYKSKATAKAMLQSKGFETLEDVATDRLGQPYDNVNFAKRGDIVSLHGDEGPALGVVDLSGRFAVSPNLEGLKYFSPDRWVKAWSIE